MPMLRPRRSRDLVAERARARVCAAHPLHGLDRGPAHQPAALLICGNPERQLAGCPLIFWIFSAVVDRARVVSGSRLGRQPDRAAAGGPGRRRRAGASSPGVGEDHFSGSGAVHDRSWRRLGLAAGSRGASGAPAYLGARPGARVRRQDGDRGVSTGAAAHSWSAVQRAGRQQQGCRELTAGSSVDSGATRSPGVCTVRRRGRGPGRRGCAGCGGSGGRACGPSTAAPTGRRGGL